jgi:hypothetical protein
MVTALPIGSTTFTLILKAEEPLVSTSYILNVIRPSPTTAISTFEANVCALATLPSTATVTCSVPFGTKAVTALAVLADRAGVAVLASQPNVPAVNFVVDTSAAATVTTIVIVTAPAGNTQTWSFVVNVQGSTNTDLKSLSHNCIVCFPTFDPAVVMNKYFCIASLSAPTITPLTAEATTAVQTVEPQLPAPVVANPVLWKYVITPPPRATGATSKFPCS